MRSKLVLLLLTCTGCQQIQALAGNQSIQLSTLLSTKDSTTVNYNEVARPVHQLIKQLQNCQVQGRSHFYVVELPAKWFHWATGLLVVSGPIGCKVFLERAPWATISPLAVNKRYNMVIKVCSLYNNNNSMRHVQWVGLARKHTNKSIQGERIILA